MLHPLYLQHRVHSRHPKAGQETKLTVPGEPHLSAAVWPEHHPPTQGSRSHAPWAPEFRHTGCWQPWLATPQPEPTGMPACLPDTYIQFLCPVNNHHLGHWHCTPRASGTESAISRTAMLCMLCFALAQHSMDVRPTFGHIAWSRRCSSAASET
jgi:hypothetical protein